jgi:hypothetical protein
MMSGTIGLAVLSLLLQVHTLRPEYEGLRSEVRVTKPFEMVVSYTEKCSVLDCELTIRFPADAPLLKSLKIVDKSRGLVYVVEGVGSPTAEASKKAGPREVKYKVSEIFPGQTVRAELDFAVRALGVNGYVAETPDFKIKIKDESHTPQP